MPLYSASSTARPYALVPSGWDNAYRTALGSASSALVPVMALGDSVLRGFNATAATRRSWWLLTMDALQVSYGNAGEGMHYYTECNTIGAVSGSGNNIDYATIPWTFAAGFAIAQGGIGGRNVQAGSGAATCLFSGTAADLWYVQTTTGGTFSVTIDGTPYDKNGVANGGGGNPTCNAGSTQQAHISYTGLSSGAHTLVATEVAGNLNVSGLVAKSSSAGILPLRFGIPGGSSYDIFDNALTGSMDTATVTLQGFTPAPKLVIWCHGVNDLQQGHSVKKYWRNSQRVIEAALGAGASVLCLLCNVGSSATNWTNGSSGVGALYQEALDRLARTYNVASLSHTAAVSTLQTPSWIAAHSNGHPDDTGHQDLSTRVLSLIQ